MKFLIKFIGFLTIFCTYNVLADDARVRIAVIDSGVTYTSEIEKYLCHKNGKVLSVDLTGAGPQDDALHGTNIAGIIAKGMNVKKQCLLNIKWYAPRTFSFMKFFTRETVAEAKQRVASAIENAINHNAKFINISAAGDLFSEKEETLIKKALDRGAIVVVAAGNEGEDLSKVCMVFPACYNVKHKNFHVVANYNGTERIPSSNYGGPITDKAYGAGGTSQSAALISSQLVHRSWNDTK